MLKQIRTVIELGRPQNAIPPIVILFISYFYLVQTSVVATGLYFVAIALLLLSMYATMQNDIEDFEIDKLNNKKVGLHGPDAISIHSVNIIAYTLLILGTVCAVLVGNIFVILLLIIGFFLALLYNHKPFFCSRKPVVSLIILTITGVLLPYALGYILQENTPNIGYIALFIGLLLQRFAVIILKDYKDHIGDKKMHKNTFLNVYGGKSVRLYSLVLGLLGYIFTVIGLVLFLQFTNKTILLSGILIIAMMYVSYLRYKLSNTNYATNAKIFTDVIKYNLYIELGLLCLVIL